MNLLKDFLKKAAFAGFVFGFGTAFSMESQEDFLKGSKFFYKNEKGLHFDGGFINPKNGKTYNVREVRETDVGFMQDLALDSKVMEKFSGGATVSKEKTEETVLGSVKRWADGQPTGRLVIFGSDQKPLGYFNNGYSGTEGVSEMGGAGVKTFWSQGIASAFLGWFLQDVAPEIQKFGETMASFCFKQAPLKALRATSSPGNATVKLMDRFGFGPNKSNLYDAEIKLDLSQAKINQDTDIEKECIMPLFDGENSLKSGKTYLTIDPEGKERAFCLKEYGKIKYEFILELPQTQKKEQKS